MTSSKTIRENSIGSVSSGALLCALFAGASLSAHAEPFRSAAGISLEVVAPPGYCALGTSEDEQELMAFQRRNTAAVGELAHMAVLCGELAAYRKGKQREGFSGWVYALVMRPGGKTVLPAQPRREFVRTVASAYEKSPVDLDALNKRANDTLKTANEKSGRQVNASGSGLRLLEVSDDAAIGAMDTQVQVDSVGGKFAATFAITLVNRLPVGLYVFGAPSAFQSGKTLATQKSYLKGTLAANP